MLLVQVLSDPATLDTGVSSIYPSLGNAMQGQKNSSLE